MSLATPPGDGSSDHVSFVLLTLGLIWLAVAHDEPNDRQDRRLDFVGAALGALGLAAPVVALVEQPERGWIDPLVLGGLIAGAMLLTAFVLWENKTPDPMLPCRLFRQRNFTFANIETLFVYAALSSLFFFLTIFLQQVAGYSALKPGSPACPAQCSCSPFPAESVRSPAATDPGVSSNWCRTAVRSCGDASARPTGRERELRARRPAGDDPVRSRPDPDCGPADCDGNVGRTSWRQRHRLRRQQRGCACRRPARHSGCRCRSRWPLGCRTRP